MAKRLVWSALLSLGVSMAVAAYAQITTYPTPLPATTAENERWYQDGGPIAFGGIVYHPSGPVRHFDRDEMLQIGMLDSVPIYIKTTQEPRSMIYVPLAGGLVRPYEQRRAGELAGTTGSVPPRYPVALPAEERDRMAGGPPQAAAPPTGAPVGAFGIMQPPVTAGDQEQAAEATSTLGMAGEPAPLVPRHVQIGPSPVGLNGIFIDYAERRWFAAGPALGFHEALRQIGEYEGFPVYGDPERPGTIYLPVVSGKPDLLTPYEAR